tara:strand:- start:476 stop:841 length:366 start_codon:yes stop_codon:yes gene_type:complete
MSESIFIKSFKNPDEVKAPNLAKAEVVDFGGKRVTRITLEPGWKWSVCNKPLAGTDSCQVSHIGVVHSGRMKIVHDDGSEKEVGPGEAYTIAPGHDAWVVGDESVHTYEFEMDSETWSGDS